MNFAQLEIFFKMEDTLNKKLKEKGNKYQIIIGDDNCDDMVWEKLNDDNLFDYNLVKFVSDNETITYKDQKEKFLEIVTQLEERRTLQQMYSRFASALKKTSPELFEDDMPTVGTAPNVYIIYIAIGLIVAALYFTQDFTYFFKG